MIAFCARVKDGTEGDIIRWKRRGAFNLRNVVGRAANDGLRTQQRSSGLDRHVILSKVNTISFNGHHNIHPIIDDNAHVMSSRENQGLSRITKKSFWGTVLLA